MELERILHLHGFGSRKVCRALVRAGRVEIGGDVCFDPFAELATEGLVFSVDGTTWPYRQQATIVLNKPVCYECSRRPIHHPSVYSLLPLPLLERGLQTVGRLDEDTTGLLLFTDDGQLNHRLIAPKHKVAKTYRVGLKHAATSDMIAQLLAGVSLHDEPAAVAAADCVLLGTHELRLVITEGKYHQVKRMVAAAGNRVESLHREAIGRFMLPLELAAGTWRWLDERELALLQEVA